MLGAIGYNEMRISNDFAKFLPSGEIVSKTQNCYALEAISIISVTPLPISETHNARVKLV